MRRWTWGILVLLLIALPAYCGKKLKYNDKEKMFLDTVDLLITLDERKVFKKKLTTHHERDRFIELFWARRDPDLTDNVNTFRSEWYARIDYVITHFKDWEYRQQSLNKGELFLLLGEPTKKSSLVDLSLMGPGYRNRYTRFPPELWTYEDPPFDYKRKRLKVQFIATSAFGEYVAITDPLTEHFLRTVKFKFIVNPELEEAPLYALSSTNYQTVDLSGENATPVMSVTAPAETAEMEDDGEIVAANTMPTSAPPVTIADRPAPATVPPPAKVVRSHPPRPSVPPRDDDDDDEPRVTAPPKTETLVVPSTLSAASSKSPSIPYDRNAGNQAGLCGLTSFFKSGTDRQLLLGRIGFPLSGVEFQYINDQYLVPFQLDYHLIDNSGKALQGESLRTEVAMPSKRAINKRTSWFSQEFALVVPSDRYTLKAQLTELNSGRISYLEVQVEVPPQRDEPYATDLVFMDPNVNPEFAKFNIRGKPYNLLLDKDGQVGDRIYPVTELVNITSDTQISTIEVQALDSQGKITQTWDLFSGELTNTNHGSFLLHPGINTSSLKAGSYTLRIEVALTSGAILISEAALILI